MSGRVERTPARVLILAAGLGKRMRSSRAKVLHEVAGAPMVWHVARAAAALKPSLLAAVVGYQAEEVKAALSSGSIGPVRFVNQARRLGTGHAVLQAEGLFRSLRATRGSLLIVSGDVPLVRASTLRALLRHHRRTGALATMLTTRADDPSGYGRVVRDGGGGLVSVVEEWDATAAQRRIDEINAGLYCVEIRVLFEALRKTGRSNAQGERYLPDIFPILRRRGRIEAMVYPASGEVLGVNDRSELAAAGKVLYRRRAEELMASGVSFIDPDSTYVDPCVKVGRDSVIYPMARLEGTTSTGRGCTIGTQAHIVDSSLGNDVTVRDMCVITGSRLGDQVAIGPFAHLRPGSVLDRAVRVGNFVEVKKSRLGEGTKANHLTYLGDAEIGKRCNIGAGTITCNYDGVSKHPMTLEDDVFIGSDTQLVAPVRVRREAYVGAGSTITRDVEKGSLTMTRAPLRVIPGWGKRKQDQRRAKKRTPERRKG